MPIPVIVWAGVAIGGLYVAGNAAEKAGDALGNANALTRAVVIGGGLYVSWRALKAAKAIQ